MNSNQNKRTFALGAMVVWSGCAAAMLKTDHNYLGTAAFVLAVFCACMAVRYRR